MNPPFLEPSHVLLQQTPESQRDLLIQAGRPDRIRTSEDLLQTTFSKSLRVIELPRRRIPSHGDKSPSDTGEAGDWLVYTLGYGRDSHRGRKMS